MSLASGLPVCHFFLITDAKHFIVWLLFEVITDFEKRIQLNLLEQGFLLISLYHVTLCATFLYLQDWLVATMGEGKDTVTSRKMGDQESYFLFIEFQSSRSILSVADDNISLYSAW